MMKWLAPLLLTFSLSACLSLEGVEIAGLEQAPGKLTKFHCENGYKGSIKVRDNGRTTLIFSDGKSTYAPTMKNIGTNDNPIYVNEKNTLKWQKQNGQVTFHYPASDFAQTKKLSQTACQTH